jgi:hypothetical protein
LWRNSSNSNEVFLLQKKIMRIMAGAQRCESCRGLFDLYHMGIGNLNPCTTRLLAVLQLLDKSLVVCQFDAQPAGPCICHDTRMIKVKRYCILPLASTYIFALMTFIVDNYEIFKSNTDVHKINTKQYMLSND